jgi:biopolymer transport protein ExbB
MFGIVEFIKEGGPFMYVNMFVLTFALAVIAERLFVVFFRLRISDRDFLDAVEKQLQAGNMDKAIKLCQLAPNAPLARVTKHALQNVKYGPAAIASAIDEAMLESLPAVRKRIEMLWSIANVATLIGLIGTITGLIGAFAAVALASPDQKSTLLTKGISEAMNNTAFGLSIAVTCIIAHMVLSNATKKISEGTEFGAVKVENILSRLRQQSNAQRADAAKR